MNFSQNDNIERDTELINDFNTKFIPPILNKILVHNYQTFCDKIKIIIDSTEECIYENSIEPLKLNPTMSNAFRGIIKFLKEIERQFFHASNKRK